MNTVFVDEKLVLKWSAVQAAYKDSEQIVIMLDGAPPLFFSLTERPEAADQLWKWLTEE